MADLEGILQRLERLEAENATLRERLLQVEDARTGPRAPTRAAEPVSRRQVLRLAGTGAGAMALAAIAAGALPAAVRADEGDVIHVGDDIGGATSVTRITNSANGNAVLEAVSERVAQVDGSGDGAAIRGTSDSWFGVIGESRTGSGVRGRSEFQSGVEGYGAVGILGSGEVGTLGLSAGSVYGTGIAGMALVDGPGHVQPPEPPRRTGVFGFAGEDGSSVGVRGASTRGRGGVFSGRKASVQLKASTSSSHPSSGSTGDLFVDKSHRLWFCKGGASWARLA